MKEPKGVHGRRSHSHWTEQCQKPTVMGLPGTKTMGGAHSPTPVLSRILSLTCASVLSLKASKIFLMATTCPVLRSTAFHTMP